MTNLRANILLLIGSLFFSLVLIEISLGIYFYMFPQTTGVCSGKICKSWLKENWRTNSLGFRDKEWDFSESNKGALFIGDSFTAGFGVKEIERYSNIAGKKHISGIRVYNTGVNNTDTLDTYNSLKTLTPEKISPNFVVYQYYGNDIEYLLNLDWLKKPNPLQKFALLFIENSFLFDMVLRPFYLTEFRETYHKNLIATYNDSELYSNHQTNIIKLFDHIKMTGAKNIFIVFPMLGSKELLVQSEGLYVKKVEKIFTDHCNWGDKLVNISSLLNSIPSNNWTASKVDSHPSAIVHEKIGQIVADAFGNKKNEYLFLCPK
jgi:hypothetical protein